MPKAELSSFSLAKVPACSVLSSLGTIDILGWVILCGGAVLLIVELLAASLMRLEGGRRIEKSADRISPHCSVTDMTDSLWARAPLPLRSTGPKALSLADLSGFAGERSFL